MYDNLFWASFHWFIFQKNWHQSSCFLSPMPTTISRGFCCCQFLNLEDSVILGFLGGSVVKNHLNNGTPLQYSSLENPMDGEAWWAAVHRVAKSQTRLSDFTFTFYFPTLQDMTIHSSVLAWRIPGTREPGGLPSMGSHRVGHNWSNWAAAAATMQKMLERWVQSLGQEDPLEKEMAAHYSILARKSHGKRRLAGSSPWATKSQTWLSEWARRFSTTRIPCFTLLSCVSQILYIF